VDPTDVSVLDPTADPPSPSPRATRASARPSDSSSMPGSWRARFRPRPPHPGDPRPADRGHPVARPRTGLVAPALAWAQAVRSCRSRSRGRAPALGPLGTRAHRGGRGGSVRGRPVLLLRRAQPALAGQLLTSSASGPGARHRRARPRTPPHRARAGRGSRRAQPRPPTTTRLQPSRQLRALPIAPAGVNSQVAVRHATNATRATFGTARR